MSEFMNFVVVAVNTHDPTHTFFFSFPLHFLFQALLGCLLKQTTDTAHTVHLQQENEGSNL